MLQITDLASGYGKLEVLSDVSLAVELGEFVAVLGPNGAGKTTLMETISGLIRPLRGRVDWGGEDITRLPSNQVVRRGIVLVPQGRRIFGPLTVERNLELGGLAAGHAFSHPVSKRQLDLVYALFPRLAERRRQRAGTMSGGEQQMLAIGRALMSDPKLLLLDEPSLGLAPKVVQDIFAIIAQLSRTGITIMLVEQNVNLALTVASRVYALSVGRIVLAESAARLKEDGSLSALYLGQEHGVARG